MSTGTIVTPHWETRDMENNSQFKPVLTEILSHDYERFSEEEIVGSAPEPLQASPTRGLMYVRRRILVGLALVLIGALIWTVLSLIVGVGETEVGADLSTTAPREIYIVSPGDTLWSIATSIDSDGDPRDTVDRLAALNGGSSLYVGQRLVLSN